MLSDRQIRSNTIEGRVINSSSMTNRSHELASRLRQMYDLPAITGTPSVNVIDRLRGMLINDCDVKENSVDAIKASREDLH